MALESKKIVTVKSLPGQVLQELPDTDTRSADDFNIFSGTSGKKYEDIGGRTVHTTITAIRAMGANGIPDANKNVAYITNDFGVPGYWKVDTSDVETIDDTGNCLVTLGGKRLKKIRPLWINVADFGCIPNGNVVYNPDDPSPKPSKGTGPDQSANLAAAIEYANAVGAKQINSSIGSPFYHLTPTLIIPAGLYNIGSPIPKLKYVVSIVGYGATLKADENWDQNNYLFSYDTAPPALGIWDMNIEGLRFDGFKKAVDVYNHNAAGIINLRNIEFIGAEEYALRFSCRSSTVSVERCNFPNSKVQIVTCNKVTFDKCRFDPSMNLPTGNYIIEITNADPQYEGSACELTLTNCFLVPKDNPDFWNSAWVRSMANGIIISFSICRIGGEGTGGLPVVLHEGGALQPSWGHQTSICIDGCEVSSQNKNITGEYAPIVLKSIPHLISVRDSTGFSNSNMIRFHPDVDGQSLVDAIGGGQPVSISIDNYTIIGNNPSGQYYASYTRDLIPIELRPFLAQNVNLISQNFTGTEIDFRYAEKNMYQSITADKTYITSNIIDGKELNILFTNSDTADHNITITDVKFGDGTSSFTVPASESVQVKLVSINDNLVGWVNAGTGSSSGGVRSITASNTQRLSDSLVVIEATSEDVTFTLLAASQKKPIQIKNKTTSTKTVTIKGDGSTNIDDSNTYTLPAGSAVKIESDGTQYYITSLYNY